MQGHGPRERPRKLEKHKQKKGRETNRAGWFRAGGGGNRVGRCRRGGPKMTFLRPPRGGTE